MSEGSPIDSEAEAERPPCNSQEGPGIGAGLSEDSPDGDWMWFEVAGRRVARPWPDKAWTAGGCLSAAGFDPSTVMLGMMFPGHGMVWFYDPAWEVWPMGYQMVVTPTLAFTGDWRDRYRMATEACKPIWWGRAPGCRFCGRTLGHLAPGAEWCAGERCITHTEGASLRGYYAVPYHRAVRADG